MCEPIPISEFVEQMNVIADVLRQFFEGLEDLFRDLAKKVEEIKKALEVRPRTSHKRDRPARISEGYPWLWVVPRSAYRSTPERGIKWRRMFRPFLHFPQTGSG